MADNRRIKHASKHGVQQFDDCVELLNCLTPKAIDILRILGTEDCTASDAVKTVPCSKSLVSHWKDFFVEIGALKLLSKSDVVKYYERMPLGSKLLAMSEAGGVVGPVYCLEDYAFRFDLLREAFSDSPIDWRRAGQPRGWDKFKGWSDGVRVVLNRGLVPSVEIHPGKIRDYDPYCLLSRSGEIVARVRDELAARHGIVLSEHGVPLHKPMFQVFSRRAEDLAVASGLASVKVDLGDGDEARLDKSPPDRKWHKEYSSVDLAVADLQGPSLLVKLGEKVRALEVQVGFLGEENVRLVDALNAEVESNRGLRESIGELIALLRSAGELGSCEPKGVELEVIRYVS